MNYDIALLTQKKYVNATDGDWYTQQCLTEDRLVKEALEAKGLSVIKIDWADPDFDWTSIKLAVFRTIWDYFHRFGEFTAWMDKVQNQVKFVNTLDQIKWNVDKHYLLDLEKKGIPIVESLFIEAGTSKTLKDLHAETGWTRTVIKPCVSGGGRHTYLLTQETLEEHEGVFKEVNANEAMILQPYQHNITTKGEVSLMVFGGKYSHAVLKLAKAGDYRVQDDFGGTVHPYEPSEIEIQFAEKVARACDPTPSYARIDVIWDNDDQLVISEVELIEPELWFRRDEKAAHLLADEIMKQLS